MKYSFFPRRRYSIFSGTGTLGEWLRIALELLTFRSPADKGAVKAFEHAFADRVEVPYAYAFGAGRMALFVILEALGIGEGDEVIIPAFTCVVVPNAIIYRGAKPVYVDIDPCTFNIQTEAIEAAITANTKAILAQHTFGRPCEMDKILEIAKRHSLKVIEDGCHALGATFKGRPVGSLGDIGFFSSDHSKMINTLLGGMITTSQPLLARRIAEIQRATPYLPRGQHMRLLISYLLESLIYTPSLLWFGRYAFALANKLRLTFYWRDELLDEKPTAYPYPCRVSRQQAILGLSQIKRLDVNLCHRRKIARHLEKVIPWDLQFEFIHLESSWLRYSFLVKDRQGFVERFGRMFELGIWFTSVLAGRQRQLEKAGYEMGLCPNGEYVARHIVNFPTHERIPVNRLMEAVRRNKVWLKSNVMLPPAPSREGIESKDVPPLKADDQ